MLNWLRRFQLHIVSRNTQLCALDVNSICLRKVSCNVPKYVGDLNSSTTFNYVKKSLMVMGKA